MVVALCLRVIARRGSRVADLAGNPDADERFQSPVDRGARQPWHTRPDILIDLIRRRVIGVAEQGPGNRPALQGERQTACPANLADFLHALCGVQRSLCHDG